MPRRVPSLLSVTLTALRHARGWKGQELAQAVGLSTKAISLYERKRSPSRRKLEEFAAAMGYDAGAIDFVLLGLSQALGTPEEPSSPVEPEGEELRKLQHVAADLSVAVRSVTEEHLKDIFRRGRSQNDRQRAARLWNTLKELTPDRRRLLVEVSVEFRSWALAERLCHESAEAASNRSDVALELAELAVRVSKLVFGSEPWCSRLEGYCLAFLANARRVGNDMRGAGEAFARARKLWDAGILADPGVLAAWRYLELEASLRRDERRFPEALKVLELAFSLAPRHAAGRILLIKGSTLEQMGEGEHAIEALREALPLIDAKRDPRLLWILRFNLAGSFCELGRFGEAGELLPEIRETAVALRRELDLVRVLWLQGKIAAGMGRPEEAEADFRQARLEFAARGLPYDAALTALDLATLYLNDGRTAEVRGLAGEMAWIFEEQGIHGEAQRALGLFFQAARQEAATAELARRVTSYLKKARHDPGLRFEE
jgi:tetratricopeptide (TPR) repeat protein